MGHLIITLILGNDFKINMYLLIIYMSWNPYLFLLSLATHETTRILLRVILLGPYLKAQQLPFNDVE